MSIRYQVGHEEHFDTGLVRIAFQPVSAVFGGHWGASGGGNPPLKVSGSVHSVLCGLWGAFWHRSHLYRFPAGIGGFFGVIILTS